MKINFHIDPELKEERGEFWLRKMTDNISNITNQLSQRQYALWCYADAEMVPVSYEDIITICAQGGKVTVFTATNQYIYKQRLNQLDEQLPLDFIQVSRDTIINYKKIDHLELLDNGKIDVLMITKQRVQISRRKIKKLKERLGI